MPETRHWRALIVGTILALVVALASLDYTVQRGDTLGRIAKEHGVSVSDLAAANNIANPNLIHPGQVLVIPGEEGEPDLVHIVARGDTLNRIAAQYGAKPADIAAANSLSNPNLIYPGQKLLVPGAPGKTRPPSPPQSGSSSDTDSDVAPAPGPGRSGAFHIVAKGESVGTIASKYGGVTSDDIVRANGILNGVIYSGTRLFLDGPGYVAKGSGGDRSYTVKSGDRLSDIAARHGTTVAQIASANSISNVNLIRTGQVLMIPGGAAWVCPVDPASFFNDWGFPRGTNRYHEGTDLFAPLGTPVRAPVGGRIEFIVGSIGGYQFTLDGVDGIRYLGSHLDSFEGSRRTVSAGEIIGYVGNSGNAQGARHHLHFGMYTKGLAVNPYPSLVANGCK